MMKIGEAIGPCEQDLKNNKVSMVGVKNRNGYANMPVPDQEVNSIDQSCDTSFYNKDLTEIGNETGDITNGPKVDRSIYEYCRKLVNSPSSCDAVDNVSGVDTVVSEAVANESSQESTHVSDSVLTSKPESQKQGHVIKKKKVKDPSALIEIENEISSDLNVNRNYVSKLEAESETCSEGPWLDSTSTPNQESNKVPLNFNNADKSTIQNDFDKHGNDFEKIENNLPEGTTKISSTEFKTSRGQRAKKSLIHSGLKDDIELQSHLKCLDNSKLVSPSMDNEYLKSQKSIDYSNKVESTTSGSLAGMTIKVNVLENALGLSTQSFSQLDAKTFDRIVLSVFQHKGVGQARKSGIGARTSAKFGSTSRHANRRIGSAFMADHVQSPQSPIMQQLQPISSPVSSAHSAETFVKKPGFLAKKTSVPSYSPSFRNAEGFASASESMDSNGRFSPNSYTQDSSTKSSFIQKARKSSQVPWSSYKSNFRINEKGIDMDSSADVNSMSNVSEDASFLDTNKRGDNVKDVDEKNHMQTRQSFKRKWDSFEDISNTELKKDKKVKSDFLVPISRLRHEASHQSLSPDASNIAAANFANNSHEKCEMANEVASYDPICLCCCLLPGIKNPMITKCQAIDSFDGKVLGCSRKVTNFEMLRPSPGTPFKGLCDDHRRRLKEHQCCPGCGLFCAQGNFFECKEENRWEFARGEKILKDSNLMSSSLSSLHRFHKQCQVFAADNKCYCPHCYSESSQLEGVVYNNEPRPATFIIGTGGLKANQNGSDNNSSLRSDSARLCMSRRDFRKNNNGSICSDSLNSFQSSQSDENIKLRNASDFQGLLESLNCDSAKLKKIRPCPKSLCMACKSGDTSRVLYILAEGVDPTMKPDDLSLPPIHLASKYDHRYVVEILLSAGVSADSIGHDLHTPLMEASQNGCLSVVELLIRAGCSVNARAHDGMTALHLAAQSGRKEVIRVLLDTRKMDINTQDDGGWTALIWATEHGHKDCITYLLSMGANPNLKDNELNTSLHWAAYTGNENIVAMFLDSGCFVNDVNDHGDTPLHISARQDHFKCVEILIWRCADTFIVNKAGLTPLQCCVEDKCKSAQQLTLVKYLPNRPKEKIITRDITRGRESCPIMAVNSVDSEDAPPDFCYILGYVETSPINVNRLVTSLQVCNCTDNCSSSSSCSCCRSSVKRWYDENGKLSGDFNFLEPPLIFECNIMCACRSTCLNRVVQLGTINNLQVFRTNGRGWGCRTLRDIAKGTFVCEYAGELISDEEANRREDDSYLFDLDFQESETYCIDAARYGNVSRFINHLCEPNVIPVKVFVDHQDLRFPRICFFASKDIKASDELGFDYGYKFWSIKWKYFTCTCGSQNCKYSKDTILKTIDEYNKTHMNECDDE